MQFLERIFGGPTLNVVTFNAGTNSADMKLLKSVTHPNLSVTEDLHAKARVATAEKLKGVADVYLLQESVGEHPFAASGLYERYSLDADGVPAVYLSKRFRCILINEEYAYSAVRARDTQTGKVILFVSAHFQGFKYSAPANLIADYAMSGDEEAGDVSRFIKENESGVDYVIMGADMNCSPEKHPGRFNIFKDFKLLRSGTSTAVNGNDAEDQEREIDYLFVKECKKPSLLLRLRRYLFDFGSAQILSGFTDWKSNIHSSDHRPVKGSIRIGGAPKLMRLAGAVAALSAAALVGFYLRKR